VFAGVGRQTRAQRGRGWSGDPEWPSQLEVLGDARLWVRGSGDLRYACLRSVSVVGTRSATAYGSHVCTEMAATLAERGWTVVSGGAYTTKTPTTRTIRLRPVQLQGSARRSRRS
jgi:DNA recombination-mediator protein A